MGPSYPFGDRTAPFYDSGMRSSKVGPCIALALALAPVLARAADFARADGIADFGQLQSLLTTQYPNLEWHARRGVDLPGNVARARAALDRAQSDADARGIFERFIARLGDAHLSIEWDANPPDPADDPTLPDCER